MKPFLIGLAGPSGSGKSSLAVALQDALGGADQCSVLPMDHYYLDLSHLDTDQRTQVNFDRPKALDQRRLLHDLGLLSRGVTCRMPKYDFTSHTRTMRTTPVAPTRFIIVEGIFALAMAPIRRLLNAGIYLSLPIELCLQRRIARDADVRGRDLREITDRFERDVVPASLTWVEPQRAHAGLLLDGPRAVATNAQRAAKWIMNQWDPAKKGEASASWNP